MGIIYNNLAANSTLNVMNSNSKNKAQAMQSISSGEKIGSAGDGAADYSISEKMRVQIRSLDQCVVNVDQGGDMLKTAAGGVQEQVEIMKQVKTLLLKATDDTYNDGDRAIIQKEVTQLFDEVEEIAVTTNFNGIPLLSTFSSETRDRYDARYIPNALLYEINEQDPNVDFFPKDLSPDKWNDLSELGFPLYQGANLGTNYQFDFTEIEKVIQNNGLAALNMRGMSLNCEACDQFVTILFDTNKRPADSEFFGTDDIINIDSRDPGCYVVGIDGVKNGADLAKAIFDGMTAALNKRNLPAPGSPTQAVTPNKIPIAAAHFFNMTYNNGALGLEKGDGLAIMALNGVRGVQTLNYYPASNGKAIQSDTSSSQWTNLKFPCTRLSQTFKDVFATTLGKVDVGTRENANAYLKHVDWEIEYLISSNTILGAQQNRLEYTEDNLVTASENTTAAESVIRDTNMGQANVEFVKNNILEQASQAMLAQANSLPQGVLKLLE